MDEAGQLGNTSKHTTLLLSVLKKLFATTIKQLEKLKKQGGYLWTASISFINQIWNQMTSPNMDLSV